MQRCASTRGIAWAMAVVAMGAGCRPAPLATAGDIAVIDGHAFPSIEGGMAAFVTIRNRGAAPDTVVGFETPDAAHIMLHRNEASGDMVHMQHQSDLVLPPGDSVVMRSGQLHLMLEHVRREMIPGDSVRLTLILRGDRPLRLVLPVEEFGARDQD